MFNFFAVLNFFFEICRFFLVIQPQGPKKLLQSYSNLELLSFSKFIDAQGLINFFEVFQMVMEIFQSQATKMVSNIIIYAKFKKSDKKICSFLFLIVFFVFSFSSLKANQLLLRLCVWVHGYF